MNKEEIIKIFGLPPDASDDQIMTALKAGAQAIEDIAAERTKAEAAEADKTSAANECEAAKTEAADAKKELENERQAHAATKTELANEKSAHEKAKADLANEQQKYAKLEKLKTQSVTVGLPNEQQMAALRSDSEKRMALVNECRQPGMSDFDAWAAAKRKNPDLFK